MVKDANRADVTDAQFVASHLNREEKGSDVNVATHLLIDVFDRSIDCAIVVSNDSDLALPIQVARDKISVGVINPGRRQIAGALRCAPTTESAHTGSRTSMTPPIGPIKCQTQSQRFPNLRTGSPEAAALQF
jgi:hypothetical protein